MIAEAFYQ